MTSPLLLSLDERQKEPKSLPPRAERIDACLSLGCEFGYRQSIV
jgi:hypothetical protein